MPTVAQKLCHDIVEPVLKQSSTNSGKVKLTNKLGNGSSIVKQNTTQRLSAPLRCVQIDKKVNSTIKTSNTSGTTITKSKTSILKNLAETAVNTLVSGPLKCDNNCVTLVRKRNQENFCKCGHRRTNNKGNTKSIQTLNKNNFSLTDKACTHYVETVTCGTQLLDKKNQLEGESVIKSKSNMAVKLLGSVKGLNKSRIDTAHNSHTRRELFNHQLDNSTTSKPVTFRYVTAKRWALTNYPTRGPDF